ncbi:hypothetical protein GCM10011613_18980 [Cellvibrio zantedeschiae]|uniref:GGDEF domain-containing protein n=1 Tax=Cellvibrio zantedeschiae TaxID=1237077 RepID=A0ABQ3B1X6_9GAMM|nr:DUF5985 family protein [Cellvibrio zantedeschiae]GGY73889.1 hypothetical protein GCM10011613_18980 [Cellvibrio zantedeschiae]
MAAVIYALCAGTSLLCAILLLRGYFKSRYRLLMWAGWCFIFVTINNLLVIADKFLVPDYNLLNLRLSMALAGLILLLYGLIFDE